MGAMILATAMILAIASISLPTAQPQTSCVSKLIPCYANNLNNTTKPSRLCCDSLKADPRCLCAIYKAPGLLARFNVSTTQAISLIGRCRAYTDLVSCYYDSTLSPASSPAAMASPGKSSSQWKRILGASVASIIVIVIVILVLVKSYKVRTEDATSTNTRPHGTINPLVWVTRYSYADIKKMTKSFSHVLGKGGFSIVYKGRLPDSRKDVAVKILKDPKVDRNQFISEIKSIVKTSHANIVSLFGYCYDGSHIALIYEYMPEGSLADLIKKYKPRMMPWEMAYKVVLDVSLGLKHLHNDCGKRIVHFDIKPDNILIGKDFLPKISDFGLAKICKKMESIMSMQGGRGTFGYMAPEICYTALGGLSYKADIYGLGMVIFEMIGLREKVLAGASGSNNGSTSSPDWIYEYIETGEITRMFGNELSQAEEKIAKKLVLVALWCTQPKPSDRPKMKRVIEMLEEDEPIPVPPKPSSRSAGLTLADALKVIDEMPNLPSTS